MRFWQELGFLVLLCVVILKKKKQNYPVSTSTINAQTVIIKPIILTSINTPVMLHYGYPETLAKNLANAVATRVPQAKLQTIANSISVLLLMSILTPVLQNLLIRSKPTGLPGIIVFSPIK
jgi:uncharacterized membrane protein